MCRPAEKGEPSVQPKLALNHRVGGALEAINADSSPPIPLSTAWKGSWG